MGKIRHNSSLNNEPDLHLRNTAKISVEIKHEPRTNPFGLQARTMRITTLIWHAVEASRWMSWRIFNYLSAAELMRCKANYRIRQVVLPQTPHRGSTVQTPHFHNAGLVINFRAKENVSHILSKPNPSKAIKMTSQNRGRLEGKVAIITGRLD